MAYNRTSIWLSGLAVNLISNAIAAIVGGIVTYLSHDGSAWVKPVLCGGAAWLITFCSILAYRVSKTVPVKTKPLDADNAQQRIRDWLDKYNMTVKSVNDDDSYFLFIVTTDGGKKISISRSKGHFSDYVSVKGQLVTTPEDLVTLGAFDEDEKKSATLEP